MSDFGSYDEGYYQTNEERVAIHLENCANGNNLYNSHWDFEKNVPVKTVNLDKPWFLVEFYMTENFANLHTHDESYSTDCDGGHGWNGTTMAKDIKGIEDEYDFKCYMIGSMVSLHNPTGRLEVHEGNSVTYTEAHDEGSSSKTITFCYDWSCEHKRSQYDQFAEQMGF